jgi:hypothetical protein
MGRDDNGKEDESQCVDYESGALLA